MVVKMYIHRIHVIIFNNMIVKYATDIYLAGRYTYNVMYNNIIIRYFKFTIPILNIGAKVIVVCVSYVTKCASFSR